MLRMVLMQGSEAQVHYRDCNAGTWATLPASQNPPRYLRSYVSVHTQPQWRFVGAFAKFVRVAHQAVSPIQMYR